MSKEIFCICGNIPLNNIVWRDKQDKILCSKCNFYQHVECVYPSNLSIPYICPLCQFSIFDPFINVKYHFLIPKIINNKNIENLTCLFNLNDDVFNMNLPDENDVLILRCLKFTTEGFTLEWPDKIIIYINDNVNPVYKVDKNHDSFKRQINEEIPFKIIKESNITYPFNEQIEYAFDYFKINSENKIHIVFDKKVKNYNNYFITLDYAKIIKDTNDIIKNIRITNDKNELKSLLKIKKDESIKEKILFIDQLSNIDTIKLPARGWKCIHFSCFDVKKFLELQKITRRFCCPICNKKVGQLYIDGVMKELIENYSKDFNGLIINENYDIIGYIRKKKKIHKEKKDKIEFIDLNENDNENENKNQSNNHSDLLNKNKKLFITTNFSNHKHSRYLDNF